MDNMYQVTLKPRVWLVPAGDSNFYEDKGWNSQWDRYLDSEEMLTIVQNTLYGFDIDQYQVKDSEIIVNILPNDSLGDFLPVMSRGSVTPGKIVDALFSRYGPSKADTWLYQQENDIVIEGETGAMDFNLVLLYVEPPAY